MIKTSRGLAPLPYNLNSFEALQPLFDSSVSLHVLYAWNKLSEDRLEVIPTKSFWTDIHVTFSDKCGQRMNTERYSHSRQENGFQKAVDEVLLRLGSGESAFFYGQSAKLLPGRLAAIDQENYLPVYAEYLPFLEEKPEVNRLMETLELIMVITRRIDPA